MTIEKLTDNIKSSDGILKINEIIDELNTTPESSYTALSPVLTPVNGLCTWQVTHNLGSSAVVCSLYVNGVEVEKNVQVVSDNVITLTFNSAESLLAEACRVVIMSNGGTSSSVTTNEYKWIAKHQVLLNNKSYTSNTTETIDISNYLPDDDSQYEILAILSGEDGNNTIEINDVWFGGTYGMGRELLLLPVINSQREIKLHINSGSAHGVYLYLQAYRKIPDKISGKSIYTAGRGINISNNYEISTVDTTGYLPPNTIITVGTNKDFEDIQSAINYLENKWSTGKVTIQIDAGIYNVTSTITLYNRQSFPSIHIIGAGKDFTTINKTVNTSSYEPLLTITDMKNVYIKDITLHTIFDNSSIVLDIEHSEVYLQNVSLQNGALCGLDVQRDSSCILKGDTEITTDSSNISTFAVITSNNSKTTFDNTGIHTINNADIAILGEMGGTNAVFYATIPTSNVRAKFSPALNSHSGTGFNLGVEA